MKVVTVATDLTNPFLTHLLNPSCAATGLELVVLHPARRTITFDEKRRILYENLSRVAGRDELIVFTDAYDTLFIRGERHIETAYERFTQPVVFSGELNSWPLGVIGIALHKGPPVGRYPYLNSGGFVGPVGDILDLCAKYPEPPIDRFELIGHLRSHGYDLVRQFGWSDQFHWTLVRLLEAEWIGVDHDATLFECLGPPVPDVVLREALRNVKEFAERGVESSGYQVERDRLAARLDMPSGAAQVHFSGSLTKGVALNLFREGLLPEWITVTNGSGPSPVRPSQVVRT